jgi:hypothetical protein
MPMIARSRRPEPHSEVRGTLLELVYSRAGLPLPHVQKLEPDEMPQPYRKLLVHSMDLTPTLEGFYQQALGLTVLGRRLEGTGYLREVVLQLAGSGKRVAYGVIRIALEHLPPPSARRVLEEQLPFGSILHVDGIPHLSWPQAFFSVQPEPHMRAVLGTRRTRRLYGRRNVLLDGTRRLLAEVLEVLAPIAVPDRNAGRPRNAFSPRRNGALQKENG